MVFKRTIFHGDTLTRLKDFPPRARSRAGYEIYLVQAGEEPSDWKPMPTIGPGVREIRVRDVTGAFRVIYVANLSGAVHVLHVFQKRTRED